MKRQGFFFLHFLTKDFFGRIENIGGIKITIFGIEKM
jgi:hypothetical protein